MLTADGRLSSQVWPWLVSAQTALQAPLEPSLVRIAPDEQPSWTRGHYHRRLLVSLAAQLEPELLLCLALTPPWTSYEAVLVLQLMIGTPGWPHRMLHHPRHIFSCADRPRKACMVALSSFPLCSCAGSLSYPPLSLRDCDSMQGQRYRIQYVSAQDCKGTDEVKRHLS